MLYFADLLLQELRSKREEVFKILKASETILENYRGLFSKRWLQFENLEESIENVYAVDSSSGEESEVE
jgi:hypothetical protein